MARATTSTWDRVLGLVPGYDPEATAGDCTFDEEAADKVVGFFADCLVFEPGSEISTQQLSNAYAEWCRQNPSERPLSRNRLGRALRAKGCESDRAKDGNGKSYRFWTGAKLA